MLIHSPYLVLQSFCFSCELTLLKTTSPLSAAVCGVPSRTQKSTKRKVIFDFLACDSISSVCRALLFFV